MHRVPAAALLAALALPALADTDIVAAPESLEHCAVCHGVELRGNRSVDAPNLSVLSAWYVERQLENYRSGRRAPAGSADLIGREMQPMAASLDDAALARAIEYVTSVPEQAAEPTIAGDTENGAALYPACAVCHGERGEGNEALDAPRLAGQSDWYLVRQLDNYITGARGAEAGDVHGAQMRAAALVLTDAAAVRDVVAWIASLSQ